MIRKGFEYEYAIRRAHRKHRKALKRKYKRYNPAFHVDRSHFSQRDSRESLFAPRQFSLLDNRDEVIKYFTEVRHNIINKVPTIMDMSSIEYTDFPTICLLIATMMDGRAAVRKLFSYLTVRIPPSSSSAIELFQKAQFEATVTKKGVADHGYFLSRLDTALNRTYSLDILNRTKHFFDDRVDLATLSPILTEVFTNTNNHADPDRLEDEPNKVPWFASILEVPEENKLCYCVIDLGIGIHESLSRKGIKLAKTGLLSWKVLGNIFNASQSNMLSRHIPGGVESSTGLLYRGQGLKDIYNNANQGPYARFELMTNKARVNIKDIVKVTDDSGYNLEGTIYYWEIYGER